MLKLFKVVTDKYVTNNAVPFGYLCILIQGNFTKFRSLYVYIFNKFHKKVHDK